jgi:hypothetical protein
MPIALPTVLVLQSIGAQNLRHLIFMNFARIVDQIRIVTIKLLPLQKSLHKNFERAAIGVK